MKNLINFKKYIKFIFIFILVYILWINTSLGEKTHNFVYDLYSIGDCKKYENKSAKELWEFFENKSNYTKFSAIYFLKNCKNEKWIFLSYKTLNPIFNINYQENPLDILKLNFAKPYPFISNVTYEVLEGEFKNEIDTGLKDRTKNEKNIVFRHLIVKKLGEDPGEIKSAY